MTVLVLVALVLSLTAVIAATAFVVVRALALFWQFRSSQRALAWALDEFAERVNRSARQAEMAATGPARGEPGLAGLRESRARLAILLSALADARASLEALVFVPRK